MPSFPSAPRGIPNENENTFDVSPPDALTEAVAEDPAGSVAADAEGVPNPAEVPSAPSLPLVPSFPSAPLGIPKVKANTFAVSVPDVLTEAVADDPAERVIAEAEGVPNPADVPSFPFSPSLPFVPSLPSAPFGIPKLNANTFSELSPEAVTETEAGEPASSVFTAAVGVPKPADSPSAPSLPFSPLLPSAPRGMPKVKANTFSVSSPDAATAAVASEPEGSVTADAAGVPNPAEAPMICP